jgi:hypothetical protein
MIAEAVELAIESALADFRVNFTADLAAAALGHSAAVELPLDADNAKHAYAIDSKGGLTISSGA